jgi:flagellar hook-length control protein FliK
MQNIPGIALEDTTEKLKTLKFSVFGKTDQQAMFADVFAQHSAAVENELAMAPVTSKEKMLDTAPAPREDARPAAAAARRTRDDRAEAEKAARKEREAIARERDERMTREDLDEMREDLKAYGMSDKEIAELEKRIDSDKGMTWNEFVTALAAKMAQMRQAVLSDEQKDKLGSFFAKLGFSAEESETLIARLENGEQDKVMSELQARLAELPKTKQLLLTKEEVEAFSSAMRFSGEFTAKLKEMIGANASTKDVREAFTLIRQEMADMDARDRTLVRAVGKAFAQAMGEQVRESSAARDIEAAVDLKPRVAEDGARAEAKAQVRDDFKGAMETRKDAAPAEATRKGTGQTLPEKAGEDMAEGREGEAEADDAWNNFFGKLKDDSGAAGRTQTKADAMEQLLKTDTSDLASRSQNRAWEKVDAPKVMRQVETAIFKNLSNGTKQLTLQLTPENLGKLSIVLQVQGKEVNAVIRADSADAARVINENIETIRGALENQGLKVEKLDVQTGLAGNQDGRDWNGSEQHNLAREREVMTAMRKHMRAMRGEVAGADAAGTNDFITRPRSEQGIHVIA